MQTNFYWLLVASLAVWRVSHLLTAEDGPWNIFVRLRALSHSSFWTNLTGCFYCLSLWVAAPCAFFLSSRWQERILLWMALSGAAILLERVTTRDETAPAPYVEEQEEAGYVLREQ
jgi:hypothetical protein